MPGITSNVQPSVSCDGNTIVWHGWNGSTKQVFKSVNGAAAVQVSMVTGNSYNQNASVSCDGSTIVWSGNDGNTPQSYKSVNGGPQTLVSTSMSTSNFGPQVSGDGSIIVYRGYDGSNTQIYKSVNGAAPVQISNLSITHGDPKISTDGSTIIWRGNTASDTEVFASKNGGAPFIVSTLTGYTDNTWSNVNCDGSVITWYADDPNTEQILATICCTPDLYFTSIVPSSIYEAGSTIGSDGTIISTSDVSFFAGDTISLDPGFEVQLNADFIAAMGGCGP